jgi:hypothetical protein
MGKLEGLLADANVTYARWNFLEKASVSSQLEGEEEQPRVG